MSHILLNGLSNFSLKEKRDYQIWSDKAESIFIFEKCRKCPFLSHLNHTYRNIFYVYSFIFYLLPHPIKIFHSCKFIAFIAFFRGFMKISLHIHEIMAFSDSCSWTFTGSRFIFMNSWQSRFHIHGFKPGIFRVIRW